MNANPKTPRLPILITGMGLAAMVLRFALYVFATDAKGLLTPWHPLEILLWALTAVAAVILVVQVRKLRGGRKYALNFPASVAAAVGCGIFAAGILLTVLQNRYALSAMDFIRNTAGLLAVPALTALAICRARGKRPYFVFHAVVCLYLALYTISHYRTWSSCPQLQDAFFPMMGCILLLLFACNSITLDNATMARHRLPASMRRFNTLLTAVFAAICALIALLPAVGRGLARCWDGIVAAITYVVLLLNRLFAGEAAVGGSPAGMPDFVPVSGAIERPSAFAIIMEKILTAFTVVFIILGTLYLLRLALRQAIRLSRRLYAALHRYVSIASEDYEDEITDTREDDGERTHLLSRRHKRRRLPTPANPGEAIRFRYARLLGDHPEWNDASTARDHLPGDAAHLYERARYSEHPVSQEDADAFSSGTRGL